MNGQKTGILRKWLQEPLGWLIGSRKKIPATPAKIEIDKIAMDFRAIAKGFKGSFNHTPKSGATLLSEPSHLAGRESFVQLEG